jgi:protein-S-isoprenylcysteine O-methyltransferase Ste14
MRIIHRLEAQGAFLFRWRSFLPLLLIPFAIPAMLEAARIEMIIGENIDDILDLICFGVSVFGLFVRGATVGFVPYGTSGRNTSEQRAHSLNRTGLYSVVRNPLYLGNFIVALGIVLSLKAWWFVALFILVYWLYIERIIAVEEAYLSGKFGKEYDDWAAGTPCFFPRFSLWRPPSEAFSLRTVLRREYNGILVVVLTFLVMDVVTDVIADGGFSDWLKNDYLWRSIAAVGIVIFFLLRTLKKKTSLLHAPGR